MATGVVVTTVLPHATPAAFTSHAASRYTFTRKTTTHFGVNSNVKVFLLVMLKVLLVMLKRKLLHNSVLLVT